MSESEAFEYGDNIVSTLSHSQKSAIVSQTATMWREATEAIQPMIDESREAWNLYLQNHPDGAEISKASGLPNRKGVRMGDVPRSVDSVHAMQHNTTFPVDERFFKGVPENEEARNYMDLYETWATQNMAQAGIIKAFFNHRKRVMLDRAACLSVPFRRKKGRKVEYVLSETQSLALKIMDMLKLPMKGEGPKPKEVIDEEAILWEGTEAESLEFTDWRVDPTASTMEDTWFMRRWYCPTWEVEDEYDVKDVQAYHVAIDRAQDVKRDKEEYTGIVSIGTDETTGKDKALLMVRYDTFNVDGEIYKNHVALVLNDSELVWFGANPYNHGKKPYIVNCYTPVPGQIYGKSLIGDIIPLAHVNDTLLTQVVDSGSWLAKPVFMKNIKDNAVKSWDKNQLIEPGMMLPVESMGSVQQLQMSLVPATIQAQIIQQVAAQIKEITGASPVFAGDNPNEGGTPTAFQVSQHVQGGQSRFQSVMSFFNDDALEPFMDMKFENDRQYLKNSYLVPGFEERLTPNIVKMMNAKFTVTANNATVQRNQEIANIKTFLMEMLPPLIQNGFAIPKQEKAEIDVLGLVRRLMVKGGFPDVDQTLKVIESTSEVTQAGDMDPMAQGQQGAMQEGPANGLPQLPAA